MTLVSKELIMKFGTITIKDTAIKYPCVVAIGNNFFLKKQKVYKSAGFWYTVSYAAFDSTAEMSLRNTCVT